MPQLYSFAGAFAAGDAPSRVIAVGGPDALEGRAVVDASK